MPKPRLSPRSINQDRLHDLKAQGAESDLLDARLDMIADEGMRKDLAKIKGKSRVYPSILPTQASLRWSTKDPNLGGFVREFWTQHSGIIKPDPGEWWVEWDWGGIEARMAIAYAGDDEDLLWLRTTDLHSETCKKYLFEWTEFPSDWKGKEDERRIRAKNFRYGLTYGMDQRAVGSMPGIETIGLNRDTLVRRARAFLQARPKLVAWKQAVWASCIEHKIARTFMGHRRLLFGDDDTRKKEGLNHMIQGSVANLMAWSLIAITRAYPLCSLILNKHDGAILAFPDLYPQGDITRTVKELVEREWEVGPRIMMHFPATWTTRLHG